MLKTPGFHVTTFKMLQGLEYVQHNDKAAWYLPAANSRGKAEEQIYNAEMHSNYDKKK